MKRFKKALVAVLASGTLFAIGILSVSAATPVYSSLSPAHETKIGDSKSFTKKLSWGGGVTNTYRVSYYDGLATGFYDPSANYYSTSYNKTYNKGSLSKKTWNTNLYVSNGSSYTSYGSVTLKDR
ncbi:hypothetical protein [Pallidibacillus pasinlerensis]|uniref:Lactococcin 972 family bacteriocin n=1 Tax=Pallidibacillus pasinlerensis TaxID=2703818 RepID=A0ABX0A3H4_9BACI|nr:hypothetical protein [Pallidibacillus pasinlerensis]NCU17952.1 hypothetical protein [Pallidibacillus pasinlerensis]